jgi:arylsulfatase A-like enzyme
MEDMTRRTFVKASVSAAAASALPQTLRATPQKRPNLLFILCDEWRAQALGCMGNPDVKTPHIDKLAADGILFRNTLANSPVCCPARSCMMTGTYVSHTGLVANDLRFREDLGSVADQFNAAGYSTAYIGKWHLDGGPREPGYVPPERRHGFNYWSANECNHNYFYSWFYRNTPEAIVTEVYEPETWTNEAIRYLNERPKDKPFFMTVSIGAPHEPYIAPQKYMDMYDPAKLTMPANWVAGTPKGGRKELAAYYAGATAVDEQVGRLLETLRAMGLEGDTIVFFSSDHGNMLGSQGTVWKRKPYEESIRVPGIFRYPRAIKAGQQTDALLAHVDYAPTWLSLCGIPVPAAMQGTDMKATVLGKPQGTPKAAFLQIFGPSHLDGVAAGWRGMRTERYLYARTEAEPWLLYDVKSDPQELHNLVSDPASQATLHELDAELTAWMAQVGDAWKLDWTVPVEDDALLYKFRTFYTVDEYLTWAKAHPALNAVKVPGT